MKWRQTRQIIAILVSLVWSVSVLSEIIVPEYQTSTLLYGVFGTIIAYMYALQKIKEND